MEGRAMGMSAGHPAWFQFELGDGEGQQFGTNDDNAADLMSHCSYWVCATMVARRSVQSLNELPR